MQDLLIKKLPLINLADEDEEESVDKELGEGLEDEDEDEEEEELVTDDFGKDDGNY